MTAPERIPIGYEPGDHTGSTGTYRDGLFLGSIVLARPSGHAAGEPPHWYAVLHLFDHDGAHTSSRIWDAGPHEVGTSAIADRADAHLADQVHELPSAQRRDIAVRPFQTMYDGITFGLILQAHPDHGQWADLLPNGLRFESPWDGEFAT